MGRHNEMVKVTTFTRPETMSGQISPSKCWATKRYQLVSDGGFSAQGVVGQPLNKDIYDDAGRGD